MENEESYLRLWCSIPSRISLRTVLVSFFLNAAPDRGNTILVNLVKAYDLIS
jgi:hypothetical protein